MKKIRILSIDGGGIRGILPGVILQKLEAILQEKTSNEHLRLADMFDFLAGTSTGGILCLAYLIPGKNQRPKFAASDALNLYLKRGDQIFDVGFWQKIKSGKGILDEKYNASALESALADNFGDTSLSELLKPCIITSYDISGAKPHFFKQHRSNFDAYNFSVKDVARATSAAPTYFETAFMKNKEEAPFALIDGGVFVNNPALVAYSEVRTMNFDSFDHLPTAKDMMILSLGTGSKSQSYPFEKAKDWGAVGWIKPLIEIMMSGNSRTVDYHLKQIFSTLSSAEDRSNYHRLQPDIMTADSQMDNASPENMRKLKEDALRFLAKEDVHKELNKIADKLIKYGNFESK
jgi:patatin-like phospholipase/acyl hydrolase